MKHSRTIRPAAPVAAILLLAGAGAWALHGDPAPATRTGGERVVPAAYHTFGGCQDLLSYLRTHAAPLVGPYGLADSFAVASSGVASWAGGVPEGAVDSLAAGGARSAAVPAPAAAAAQAGATSDTGTNVQVAGVDEADVSKRSGDLVLTVTGRRAGLTVLRTSADRAELVGRLDPGWRPESLLVQGSTVLLLGSVPLRVPEPVQGSTTSRPVPALPYLGPGTGQIVRTRVAQVDIADPAHPRVVRTLDVDGSAAGARLSGGVLRLAISARPSRLPFVMPQSAAPGDTSATQAVQEALARNRSVVAASTVDDWLPHYTLRPALGKPSSGTLLGCASVGVPDGFSGLGTLAMLTFDLRTEGIGHWNGAGVVADGTTLYSTGDHTYVATSAWSAVPAAGLAGDVASIAPQPSRTQIHAFATTSDGVRYLGSGQVDGRLLDQYSLDEYQGRLRVATTTEPVWNGGVAQPLPAPEAVGSAAGSPPGPSSGAAGSSSSGAAGSSSSGAAGSSSSGAARSADVRPPPIRPAVSSNAVTVLQLRSGRLEQVGRVGDLGRGEVIHAVRFAGPIGYVVTFRRTDPLYTLDLSDPAHPSVAGEVALLGYSAYLHPLGDGLLLGVGRDATAEGTTTGVLMSLFDVSDVAHPRLRDRVAVPGAWSGTEADPHAFTFAAGLALVPLESGVLAVRVNGARLGSPDVLQLDRAGSNPQLDPSAVRTFVDPDRLWTVAPGSAGTVLTAHDVRDLSRLWTVWF